MIKNENYVTIQGWMVNELNLKGNELFVYAVIYSFCQDENSKFSGSLDYLAKWTNSTKQGVLKNLKNLLEKNLIEKEEVIENGVKFVKYATKFNGVLNKVEWGIKQSLMGVLNKVELGIKQSLPNNIEDNIEDNIENNINIKEDKKNEKKLNYGEFKNVKLTDKEYEKLKEIYADKLTNAIETLSSYLASKGDKYKSHYAVLGKHNWVYKKINEEFAKKEPTIYNSYM